MSETFVLLTYVLYFFFAFSIFVKLSIATVLKFIYSEKATKFCKIFPLLLTVFTAVKKRKISQHFVAFSEYMNFTYNFATTLCNHRNIFRLCIYNIRLSAQTFAYYWFRFTSDNSFFGDEKISFKSKQDSKESSPRSLDKMLLKLQINAQNVQSTH